MERISYPSFVEVRDSFDAAVARTPDIGRFCSGSAWNLAARASLDPAASESAAEDFIWREAGTDSWLLFRRSERGFWQPFESAWMFACPVVGPDPESAVDLFAEAVRDPGLGRMRAFALGGIPDGSPVQERLRDLARRSRWRMEEFPGTDSLIIDLAAGAEPWLERRSRKFRRSLDAARRRCESAGLRVESHRGPADGRIFERMLHLQRRTAKWASGSDIFLEPAYRAFYERLFNDLSLQGAIRLLFATRENEDLGYLFGGVLGDEYRGLQMSYDARMASCGVGNWLQWENLRERAAEGIAVYDLGMEAEYKWRWADRSRIQRIAFFVL